MNDTAISKIEFIKTRYDEIANKDLGPWSEVSEVTGAEREADAFIKKIDKSILQQDLADGIRNSEDPWTYIEFIINEYHEDWVIQPSAFFKSIIESSKVKKALLVGIPRIISNIQELEQPQKALATLINVNSKIREIEGIIDMVRMWMDLEEEINPYVISHSLILNKVEAKVISVIEKSVGRIPHLSKPFDTHVDKSIVYSLGYHSSDTWGYGTEDGKIVRLGLTKAQISSIPNCLCDLTGIRILFLNNIGLTSLPTNLGHLTELEGLYLDSNKLKSLPVSITNCSKLGDLYIRSNPIKSLPKSFYKLTNLVNLYIQNTKLSSKHISPLQQIKNLDLSFVYSCLAENMIRDNNKIEAVNAYMELFQIDPNYSEVSIFNFGNLLNSLGRYAEAQHYLEHAGNFESYKTEALISLGFNYFHQNKLDMAESTFLRALEDNTEKRNEILVLINLGAVYLFQAKLVDAEEVLIKALKLDPKNGEIFYNLSCLYARKNNSETSLDYLEKAIDSNAALLAGIDNDTDFNNIRESAEFQRLMTKYKAI